MMKKTVKLVSGLTLAAAFMFVAFSSFSTPDEVVNTTPEAVVVVDVCGCPPGWSIRFNGNVNNANNLQWDTNGDGLLCYKWLPVQSKGKGNAKGPAPRNFKDNNLNANCD